jgi:threonine/homoserine/homoserine lactone efflux protein
MSPLATFLAFAAAAMVLIVTPGMDTALVLRTSAVEGHRRGLATVAGICTGCLVWGTSVALGLGALLVASHTAYTLVKWAGAAYLAWLGVNLLLKPRERFAPAVGGAPAQKARFGAFGRGLGTNLLNPKCGVFYVSFLPMFVPHGWPVGPTLFGLCLAHVIMGFVWLGFVAMATAPLGQLLARPGVAKWLDRATGSVFLAFGAKLAFDDGR